MLNNAIFGKSMGTVGKKRDINLVTTERRRNYLVSEPYYHNTKFCQKGVVNRNEKSLIYKNEPVYLRLSILELNKILMFEF